MENTTKTGGVSLPKTKLLQVAALVIFAFIICRGPLMGGFPVSISFITYMMFRSTVNLYLLLPASAGMLPYMTRGMEPWADMIAMCVCGLFFVAARRVKMEIWHRAIIAAAIGIVCISIYRLATATVYKTGVEQLLLESMVILAGVFVFRTFFNVMEKLASGERERIKGGVCSAADGAELPGISMSLVILALLNGAGLSSLAWPALIFICLWLLADGNLGTSLASLAAGGAMTALMGQGQWGMMATLLMALAAASFLKKYGALPVAAFFALACWGLSLVESGVVLGVEGRCLFISSALFAALHWKFNDLMTRLMNCMMEGELRCKSAASDHTEKVFAEKLTEINDLAELYATYLDSRAILADQLGITAQILEDAKWQLSRGVRTASRHIHEKIDVDIAISQCAAAGAINGDCCGWQDIGGGKIALVVSDGMGKGKKAAAESLMVTKTLLSLLRAGAAVDITLKILNTIMLMKEDEDSYATVDLVIIDKNTSRAKFYKIGAAPTLIRRKENVEEVKLSAVPLGIVNGLKIRYVETTLKRDDWIIMMSDGVSDGGGAGTAIGREFLYHLRETAADVRSKDPQTMSDLLLNQAADSYMGKERDDMTVMVAKVV